MLKYQLGFMWCFTIKETGFQVIQISDNDNNLNIEFFSLSCLYGITDESFADYLLLSYSVCFPFVDVILC